MEWFQKLFSAASQRDDQQQNADSRLQSDSSVDNNKQVQILTQDLENLVLSSKDEVIDRYIEGQSVVIVEEEQVKQVDEDHRHLVVKEVVNEAFQSISSIESEAKNHWDVKKPLIVGTMECRVLEERETGERCEIQAENVDDGKDYEHKYGNGGDGWEEGPVSSEIGSFVDNGGDGWEEGPVIVPDDGKSKSKAYHYPLIPDRYHYTRTDCKVDHPLIDKSQESRVTKELETGERCEIHEKVYEHKNGYLKEKHEIVIEDRGVNYETGSYENNGWEEGSVSVPDGGQSNSKAHHYPFRSNCSYYMRTGTCKFRSNCRFNHPFIDNNQPIKETKKKMEENSEKHEPINCKFNKETQHKKEENTKKYGPIINKYPTNETKKKKEENVVRHRPTDCKPTMETKKKKEENAERHGPIKYKHFTKDTMKKKEENVEKHGPNECKYHMSSTGFKNGNAYKFNHGKGKNISTPVKLEYNFVGLPIRPGEKECMYYMSNGSCQYGRTCKLHHPNPIAVEDGDAPTSSLPLKPEPQPNIPNMPSWSPPRTPDPTAAFVPPMMYSPPQNMPPPNPDWYVFQDPAQLYPSSEWDPPIPPPFFPNNPQSDTTHHQQPALVSEYPERRGQPDCRQFMKFGNCKNGALCRFRHPESRITQTVKDQNICSYFSKHGTCKYGSACKYNHPVNSSNSIPAGKGKGKGKGK